MHSLTKILFLSLLMGVSLYAAPTKPEIKKEIPRVQKDRTRRFWFDLGFGLPQLIGGEASYRALQRWQFGAGGGILPGGEGLYAHRFSLPSQSVTLKNNDFVKLDSPTLTSSLATISTFVRFFPVERNFYFQLTLSMLRNKNRFQSGLSDASGVKIDDGEYRGSITLIQFLPTISIGHAFASNLFFFNVNMGISFIATVQASVYSEGRIPDRLGGTAENQEVFDKLNTETTDAINQAVTQLRKEIPVIPSFCFTFGFMF